jgi:hypothetical protein
MTAAELATLFLRVRDRIEAIEARHKEELAGPKAALEKLKVGALAALDKEGVQNMKIPGVGTMFKKKVTNVKVAEWDKSLEWVVANSRWDALERRMNKTVVLSILEETGSAPPGVEVTSMYDATVQRV